MDSKDRILLERILSKVSEQNEMLRGMFKHMTKRENALHRFLKILGEACAVLSIIGIIDTIKNWVTG